MPNQHCRGLLGATFKKMPVKWIHHHHHNHHGICTSELRSADTISRLAYWSSHHWHFFLIHIPSNFQNNPNFAHEYPLTSEFNNQAQQNILVFRPFFNSCKPMVFQLFGLCFYLFGWGTVGCVYRQRWYTWTGKWPVLAAKNIHLRVHLSHGFIRMFVEAWWFLVDLVSWPFDQRGRCWLARLDTEHSFFGLYPVWSIYLYQHISG